MFRDEVVDLLAGSIHEITREHINSILESPDPKFGDFAFPTFILAKTLRKAPSQIATELAVALRPRGSIKEIRAVGPYVNFFIDPAQRAPLVIRQVLTDREYGKQKGGKKIVIEYPSPNTNKPLHLGHVRNMLLGQSLASILSFAGNKVITTNLNNDRGVHICKAMYAYEKFGKNRDPDKKPDHFVGDYYVKFSRLAEKDPKVEEEVQEMLVKWENSDPSVRALWKKLNGWALEGFRETYDTFGIVHDKVYNESDHYMKGKELVLKALNDGKLEKDEKGNVIINLESRSLPNKILLRADGTSIYMTQDLYLARLKYEDFKMDRSVYVVGSEQILHFQQLFAILKDLGVYEGDCFHLAHGMVYLPEGKMKSREGKVVDADNLVDEMVALAREEVKKRDSSLDEKEVEKRARAIGMGAIRFFILKYDPLKDFTFNPQESIAFEGETGPYVQYANARISSIFEKFGKKIPASADFTLLTAPEEAVLVRHLESFPAVAAQAAKEYKPLLLARFALELAQSFNQFYHAQPILQADDDLRDARLVLCRAVQMVLQKSLALLHIDAPEKM